MKIGRKILIVFLVFISFLFIISGCYLLSNKKGDEIKQNKISHITSKNGSITCTRETFQMQNYKIDYQYDFSFTDGKVDKVSTIYIYTFETKESYDLFDINFSDGGLQYEKGFNRDKLTKKYVTHVIDEEYADDVNQYLSYVQENGYICREVSNEK